MSPRPILETSRRLRSIATRRSMLPGRHPRGTPRWEETWEYLFALYAPAMERYVAAVLARALRRPAGEDDARELVAEYWAHCLEKGWLDGDLGDVRCFRAYLQTQLKRFVYKRLEHRFARKRHAGALAPPEALDGVAGREPSPEAADLDAGWVAIAVEQALAELRLANDLYAEIIADLLRTDGEGNPDLADRLGKTPTQLVHLRHRARQRFAVLFHEQLRATVRDDDAFESLCRDLAPYLP